MLTPKIKKHHLFLFFMFKNYYNSIYIYFPFELNPWTRRISIVQRALQAVYHRSSGLDLGTRIVTLVPSPRIESM